MQSKYAANSGIYTYTYIHTAREGWHEPRIGMERKRDRRSAARRIQNRYPRIRYTHEWVYLSRYRSYARASFSRFSKIPTTSTRHSPPIRRIVQTPRANLDKCCSTDSRLVQNPLRFYISERRRGRGREEEREGEKRAKQAGQTKSSLSHYPRDVFIRNERNWKRQHDRVKEIWYRWSGGIVCPR